MKKLVSVNDVKATAEKGQKVIEIHRGMLITPSAKDLARELGIEITQESTAESFACQSGSQQPAIPIDKDLIYQVVKALINNHLLSGISDSSSETPFLTETEQKSGLKIVRGRTVRYEDFDTGKSGTQVQYREVICKDESSMSAGFLTIEKSSFDWELCYEEIDIILEGSLSITINGSTFQACQGDVIFIPKGSNITLSSSGYVKLFYITYPANWPDLLAKR